MRHAGLWRAFDLSVWGYFLDFALVPIAVILLLARDGINIGLIVAGLAAWTFAEYWIHRLVFHWHTPFEPMHQMHHALPKDMIGAATWITFSGFAVVWLIAGASICAGFMLGYLGYCAIHVRMHHGDRERFGRYVTFMFDHHAAHHRGGLGNFGVSSPVWDYAFRSYQPQRTSP